MSDIREEQKRLYKRAEENDLSLRERQKLNGMTLGEEQQLYWEEFKKPSYDDLQNRIDKAIEYIENCPYERDEFDDFDDMWHSGEIN